MQKYRIIHGQHESSRI